jgi:DNA-directed RNA polymerase specialized sigma subunit
MLQQALVEEYTAFFVAHTSLNTNERLWKAIDELREQDETHFERLIKEVSGEVLAVWREKRTAWKGRYFQPSDLMEMRTEVARRLEKRDGKPPIEAELAEFCSREDLLKQGRDAGLPPQEFVKFKLLVTEPGLKYREYGTRLGISASHVSVLKTRIKKTLRPTG